MMDQKDETQKNPWKTPEIEEIKAEDTEAFVGGGGDAGGFAS